MGPVTKGKEDFLGGSELTFQATSTKGRVFNCSTFMTPGILLEPPTYSRLTCTKQAQHPVPASRTPACNKVTGRGA